MAELSYRSLEFSNIPGWKSDDVGAALVPFANCAAALKSQKNAQPPRYSYITDLSRLCSQAAELIKSGDRLTAQDKRFFFENNFEPYKIVHSDQIGLLTGYYEPALKASRIPSDQFKVPIYRRPHDLITKVCNELRGSENVKFTHMQSTENGLKPFADRASIEQGALAGRGLELLYLEDPVEAFILHVQGSGLLHMTDGTRIRIGYDGKNGYPYTSIGRYIAENGWLPKEAITLSSLKAWLRSDPERGRNAMWQNKSFIFFKELGSTDTTCAQGAHNIPLTAGRSLAVDGGLHQIGLPIFVSSPTLNFITPDQHGLAKLLVAQDVGSAITGPERGDLFYGSGDIAGELAGRTKHACNFILLLPKGQII